MAENEKTIGEKIREYRQKRGLTQDALAAELHISSQAISKWENGQTMPDINLLVPISKVLKIGLNDLLGTDRRAELEHKWQQAVPLGEEMTLLVAEEALEEFPDDETFRYRRARDLYTIGKRKKTESAPRNHYLSQARLAFMSLCDSHPDDECYKSYLALTEFELGNRERAFVLAYSLKDDRARGNMVTEFRGGDDKIKYEQNNLYSDFINLFNNLMGINTRESINAVYALLDALMPESKRFFSGYSGLLTKDAHLCLAEGDVDGFAEKYRMAYDAVKARRDLPQERISYTDPLFDHLSYVPDYNVRIEGFVYWFADSDEASHPALLDLRREIVRDCISCRIIRADEWQKYFNFCSTHICDDYNLNFGMCWYIPEEEQAAFNNSLVGKNWCHERLMENNKDQIERVIGGGLARGTVARCGDSIYAYCHCGLKESFENLPGDVKNIVTAPEGSKICSIVEIMTAKCFIGCGIEEKLIDMTLEWHKARRFTHAETYLIERIFKFRDPSRFDEMLEIYKRAGFEIIRDLTNEDDGRYYIMQKVL
jgi:transcriptional regulator with XRE-family HTH domain